MANDFLAVLLGGLGGGLSNYAGTLNDNIKSKREDEKLAKQIELFKQKSDLGLRNAGLLLGAKDILKDGGNVDFTQLNTPEDFAISLSNIRKKTPAAAPKFSFGGQKPAAPSVSMQNPYASAAAAEIERRKRARGL